MVKKLFRYELKSYSRSLMPMQLILFCIALLTRLIWIFESDNVAFTIFGNSAVIAFVIACIVCCVMTFVLIIRRFYKNLYSPEGYLSFTLPVNCHQHICAKLLAAMVLTVGTALALVLSICVATCGELTVELFKAAGYLLNRIFREVSVFPVLLAILAGLLFIADTYLLFYACITIGQKAKKNRVLAAAGVYFAWYLIRQLLGTILLFLFVGVEWKEAAPRFYDFVYTNAVRFVEWGDAHVAGFFSIIFGAICLVEILVGLLYYFVTHRVMSRKLNLE